MKKRKRRRKLMYHRYRLVNSIPKKELKREPENKKEESPFSIKVAKECIMKTVPALLSCVVVGLIKKKLEI